MSSYLFTSESVSEGHPDKVADAISDEILDAYLRVDPRARVAVETLVKDDTVVIAGEVTSSAEIELESTIRETVRKIGYNLPRHRFHADRLKLISLLGRQSPQIAQGVGFGNTQGAGDQGIMFGFATSETPERLPLPIALAHAITRQLTQHRQEDEKHRKTPTGLFSGYARANGPLLGPDAKSQVTVRYSDHRPVEVTDIVVSTQHQPFGQGFFKEEGFDNLRKVVVQGILPKALGAWWHDGIRVHFNPAGEFTLGGPEADAGVTGRKTIVDTYGGFARHGGGAFSGKDPSKVDRSAAYFTRWIARQIVDNGIAEIAELQVSYAIGEAEPISVLVDTRGTGDVRAAEEFARKFDFRPGAIIERLDLLRPIYAQTTNYGHFGKAWLPWEISPKI